MEAVGARGLVHRLQFNGKQEGCVARSTRPHLRCPRNGQADELASSSVSVNMPLVALNKRLGRRQRLSPPSPDTGQQGGGASEIALLERPSTVGEGGEDTQLVGFMKMSFLSARWLASAFSLCLFGGASLANESSPQVVVTASRTAQILTDALPHTTVLGRDVIEQSQLVDLPSLLAREAGFQFTQNGGRGSQATAFLRGAASLQVLVLVDGMPMTKQDTTGAVSLEHIMLDQVDHIEIVRGNVSAIYGSGAIGGVIQVFTRQGQGAPTASVSTELGSLGSQRLLAGAQGKAGDWRYAVSAGTNSTRGINAINVVQGLNVNPDLDGYKNANYTLHVAYDLNAAHQMGLRANGSQGRFDYDVSDATYASTTDIHKGATQINNNALFWTARFSETWKSRIQVSDGKEKNTTETVGLYPLKTQALTHTQLMSWVNEFQFHNVTATLGMDRQLQAIEASDDYSALLKKRALNAIFAGGNYTLGVHSFQMNVRSDDVQDVGVRNSSYWGYGHELNAQWKWVAAHSTAFNIAPLGYLYDPSSGNPNLKPETAQTNEVGLQWANGPHRMRSTLFSTHTRDMLLYDMTTWQFNNVASVKNEGLETSYSGRLGTTDVRASLTLQHPINEATGQRLVRRAQTLASTSVSQLWGPWVLGASLRYTGARPDTLDNPELPSYTLVDLTARYPLSPEWVAFGRVENLTDKIYQTAYGYNQLPRTMTVGLTWKMKP